MLKLTWDSIKYILTVSIAEVAFNLKLQEKLRHPIKFDILSCGTQYMKPVLHPTLPPTEKKESFLQFIREMVIRSNFTRLKE